MNTTRGGTASRIVIVVCSLLRHCIVFCQRELYIAAAIKYASALEALRNALYKFKTYLLIYLLADIDCECLYGSVC